ncbi:AMP-binding protein [Halobacillus shinanisalinarum]|uniref:acetate--CoA ligase n=1 Tax=Halobacillus shinanisalinarum TaxID=2932258 RepID=A0ABY4GZ39_9BACI|nr:AMP-binding protein [Halobacillus shinanisalinarum]UOQ93461.1 AMP-binding protein [Halobacillus shinanisalinarum]
MSTYEAAWFPSDKQKENTRLYKWMKKHGYENYDSFQKKSTEDIAWFWDEAVAELGVEWEQPYTQTLDLSSGIKYPEWFVNGRMNVAHNALDKWSHMEDKKDDVALYWEGDDGMKRTFTYIELYEEVNAFANGLEKLGLGKGDVITIYLPMLPETLISMLAVSKIGAIFCPTFSGYKAEAIATRIQAAQSKVLITADGFYRRGKSINMKDEADLAADQCNTLEHVIVVERSQQETAWNEKRDLTFEQVKDHNQTYKTKPTNANDPYMLIYTSGTTGKPKGVLHTHAGFPIKSAFDAGLCMDVTSDDTIFWFTDMGWMMGPFLVYGGLMNGASIVMFEGTPDYPQPDRLWELVDRYQVTHLGISPTLIRSMIKHGIDWIEKHDLSSLKLIGSTGEPWNPEPWHWLFRNVGNSTIPIFNYSGGTEVSGGIFGNVLVKPIQPVTFNAALPGMDVDVYDDEGNSLTNKVGELVLKQPWVGMTKGFYQDNKRYEQTYWSKFEDTWVHGDWVTVDEDGYYTITGRSDDVLNVAGKRLGPAEVESVLVSHDAVIEAGVIGVPHDVKGEEAVAFAVLKSDQTDSLMGELKEYLANKLGKALAPKKVFAVSDLPKTRNAKVMRRAIKSAYLNEPTGDLSALENPQAVDEIRSIGLDQPLNK